MVFHRETRIGIEERIRFELYMRLARDKFMLFIRVGLKNLKIESTVV